MSATVDIEELVLLPGQEIFAEKSLGDAMYLIKQGAVEIWVGQAATPTIVARLEEGAVFGEAALVNDAPRNASARAAGHGCVLLSVPREAFRRRLDEAHPMIVAVARLLIDGLVAANRQYERQSKEAAGLRETVSALRAAAQVAGTRRDEALKAEAAAMQENRRLREKALAYIEAHQEKPPRPR
ncbi:cyclic nucleotide-binding domain-containing protein [Radicibacter daui]|uniref:cyclic nucleotide-binding domain-containing protein n=1 Tax=Radicibacter daui TaxID=3064829 RepID=UPI004046C3E0